MGDARDVEEALPRRLRRAHRAGHHRARSTAQSGLAASDATERWPWPLESQPAPATLTDFASRPPRRSPTSLALRRTHHHRCSSSSRSCSRSSTCCLLLVSVAMPYELIQGRGRRLLRQGVLVRPLRLLRLRACAEGAACHASHLPLPLPLHPSFSYALHPTLHLRWGVPLFTPATHQNATARAVPIH